MRRCTVLHILLCVMATCAVLTLTGCGDGAGFANESQWWFLYYEGDLYISTGATVASTSMDADVPSKLMYVGQASLSATDNYSRYSVYLIRGLDENEAFATRYAVSGGHYQYIKYERLYGQVEPAGFVYNGVSYKGTGETVDFLKVGSERVPSRIDYLSSVTYQGIPYDVYSIQDRDENQEIAVKIAKAGKTLGFYSLYFRYVRE